MQYWHRVIYVAITVVNESADVNDITTSLKNIAAAHFIIVLAITGDYKRDIFDHFYMLSTIINT